MTLQQHSPPVVSVRVLLLRCLVKFSARLFFPPAPEGKEKREEGEEEEEEEEEEE